ncbi:MAG: C45 family autoproteolytic acyltransferase/hydrolase [Thalassobaculum sp.]|uniref:C45 family autoproteolytic acyltransferase/hydolase n=1 Tax=Thalassobaculum sp. TaxID=2022740 RepID=UPI0032EC346D
MHKRFTFVQEDRPAEEWLARFVAGREAARRWYLGDRQAARPAGDALNWHHGGGRGEPPTAAECRAALARHMPELLKGYDRACAMVGDDPLDHCILSHYRPAPEAAGCTLAVWLGDGGPALVRQQDFPLDMVSDRFELTIWSGRRVIGKAQRPWGGLHDGMNDAGLVVTSTFGGAPAQGLGFAVILITRYLLEACSNVKEAVAALRRIPIALSHNVMLLDRTGDFATVYLGPDREPAVTRDRATTNHQETVVWLELAARSLTVERWRAAQAALDDPGTTLASLTARFLEPPIYSRAARSPSVYTAVYRPAEGRVDYLWPGTVRSQGFERFEAGEYVHDFGALTGA